MTVSWGRMTPVAATIAIALLLLKVPTAGAEVYQNSDFGIEIPLPKGLPTCGDEPGSYNHGITIYLDPNDTNVFDPNGTKGCDDDAHRYISVFVWYNAVDETKTLDGYVRWECELLKGRCVPGPKGLRIATSQSATVRVNRPDGWIDISVLTQAGRAPDQATDDPTGAVNYGVTLHTDRAHLTNDLRRFRSVLRTIRLSQPE